MPASNGDIPNNFIDKIPPESHEPTPAYENGNAEPHGKEKAINKLEFLLSQPDIFDYLKRIHANKNLINPVDYKNAMIHHSKVNNTGTLRHKKTENEEEILAPENSGTF